MIRLLDLPDEVQATNQDVPDLSLGVDVARLRHISRRDPTQLNA